MDASRRLSTGMMLVVLSLAGCSGSPRVASADDGAGAGQDATASSPDPADKPRHTNRLVGETSPYLLLHAHNPVDWYPWGPEALEAAKAQNKPIFLSIGYSSCFWCHVMEREVFESEEIAKYMNEHFINIKVDREERPDLDDIYMTALQVYYQATGSGQGGGWPLSIFLTPDGHPIAGGTYFPPADLPGRPGFPTVLRTIDNLWKQREADLRKSGEILANEVRRVMKPAVSLQPIAINRSLVDAAVAATLAKYDPEYGGLDFDPQQPDKPKFPVPSRLMLLQAQAGRGSGDPQTLAALDKTLAAMAAGGIYDHLAGGFHRYSTDRQWRVPHFEKMLYDNAQLAAVYSHAWRRTNRKSYQQTAVETFAFVLAELTGPQGGCYSALDAETDGVEGAYYVWSRDEVDRILGVDDGRVFQAAYGLSQPEFFEHGYVLHWPRPLADTAEQLQIPEAELASRLAEMRAKLLEARRRRPPLLKDDKVLTSWTGLMIAALADGGRLLDRPEYVAAGEKAALFIADNLRDDEGRLLRTWRNGEARLDAYLEDYAFLIHGLLALHEATGEEKWLHAARRLMDDQIDLFWDPQEKGFFFTSHDHEKLLARTKDAYDSVLPSGNSVSVRNLVRLAVATGDERYRNYATDTLRTFAEALQRSPGNLPYMALALQEYLDAFGEPAGSGRSVAQPAPSTAGPPKALAESATSPKLQPFAVQPEDVAGKHKARATAYLAADKLSPGAATKVAVVVEIAPGWHLNANPPRPDFVVPTELSLTSKPALTLESVTYPAGQEFRVEGIDETLLVYEHRVVLFGELKVPAEAAGQTADLTLTLRYQACNDRTCTQPLKVELSGRAPVAAAGAAVTPINRQIFEPATKPR